jgi:phosphoesterase RecJ-like protein
MIQSIVAEIACYESFLITSHESPDGDAVGSTLALANYLRRLGKDVTIFLKDQIPECYMFLPMADLVQNRIPVRSYDVCFVLDVGEFNRAGKELCDYKAIGKFINIDHHLSSEEFGTLNLIDPQACATGALIYRIIKSAGHNVDYDTALCIYTAIITDTGSFRYSNSNPEAFAIAGEMIATGVNAWYLAEKLYESQPRQRLQLLALALATLSISKRGDYASITVTQNMYALSDSNADLTDGFINYPRSIRGVEVAIMFREIAPDEFKVGFRSKGKVDVSAISAAFQGGGHHNAAGCKVKGSLEQVKQQIYALLEKSI